MKKYKLNFYLTCPYPQRRECKKIGGKFDWERKQWYVPPGRDLDLFKNWWGTNIPNEQFITFDSDNEILGEADFEELTSSNFLSNDLIDKISSFSEVEIQSVVKKLRKMEKGKSNQKKVLIQDNVKSILHLNNKDKDPSRYNITNYGGLHNSNGSDKPGMYYSPRKRNNE